MQNLRSEIKSKIKKNGRRAFAVLLLLATMLQIVSVCCLAVGGSSAYTSDDLSSQSNIVLSDKITTLTSDEAIAQLKKDLLSSINQNLVKRIDEYELKGEVGVILTFSDSSLIESYLASADYGKMTYTEYSDTVSARLLRKSLERNQTAVLDSLVEAGLITEVKHTYSGILDGAFVRTTYENIAAISEFKGVERITISNTYNPAVAVENDVNVYDTGIFNSGDVTYTGKGTLVAILDTGCDYTHTAFTTHQVADPQYDRDYVAERLPNLIAYSYDTSIEAREVYYGNVTLDKIVFGYDYADKDPNILPFTNSHGTHVAGIIGGKDDKITGVAIDTQFAIMKVFSDKKEGAEDGDILAALEDSVALGVDAINMSLGSSCGFTLEYAPDETYKNEIYDRIDKAGISLIAAASNDYSSGYGSDEGNTNKTENPDSGTIGAPATYGASMSVASINGNKENYMLANGSLEVFFHEAVNQGADEYDFFEMLGITAENPTAELEYVTVPGYGYKINYSGIDVKGKIALIRRGDITFEEKIRYAYEAGARAAIIYNNVFGEIIMTVGNDLKIPVISIGKDEGDALAALKTGKIAFDYRNEAGPFMSDFSSWGPTPDLQLKPEITAHGGNIYSAIIGGEYEEQSGTSMAAPNMCGITVLIRQYVKEKYGDELTDIEIRDRVYQLCMSTATIALDQKGNPYSPRKQGAGIADIKRATQTPAYLYVDGIGRTKLELGDDAKRTGVYTMTVCLENTSDASVSYRLGNITMTESVSTSDPEYVAEMAYLLSPNAEYTVNGVSAQGGIVTVAAGETAEVTVTLRLTAKDKSYLNSNFKNGMYVEGYLTFDNTDENGIDLNAPFLAFYGDWNEAPIFDLDFYEEETEAHNNAIDEDDKIKADYYPTTPLGTYYYDYLLPLGSYLYEMDESEYTAIPATREHSAISLFSDSISGIYGVFAGMLRGARKMSISIVDTSTGEVVWEDTQYNCYKAHFHGVQYPYISRFNLPMYDAQTGTVFGNNNTRYEVTMSATLDWDGGEIRNESDTYSFSFYIDYEAPAVTSATFRVEYDKGREENRYYVDVMVYDNHYAMSLRPVLVYDVVDSMGREKKTYSSLIDNPIPIYQENKGETTKVTLEITDYLDIITNSNMPEGITLYIDDYALNGSACYIPFPNIEDKNIKFSTPELECNINQTYDLTELLVDKDGNSIILDKNGNPLVDKNGKLVGNEFFRGLQWSSSDESVVTVTDGHIQALKSGSATIKVTGSAWTKKSGSSSEQQIYKTIKINVSDVVDPLVKPQIEAIKFSSYKTLFAHNSDIDPSEIGRTGSVNYFGGNYNISFYPSERVKLSYDVEPWNLTEDKYTLKWKTSNPKVATVTDDGEVTAIAEGVATITLEIIIDGKTSLLTARCRFEVKSEFIVENRTLIAYKGNGGDVVIPDDEGIWYIGAYAFAHYALDNEREVEKDENGNYDLDDKKDALGNKTITSVIIPEGVEKIEKYAFYKCENLEKITIPKECTVIDQYAFYECTSLESINLDDVNVIGDRAFYNCKSLTCDERGGANFKGVYAIGDYAFYNTAFTSIELDTLSNAGVGAFAECRNLSDVTLGNKTRVSKEMFKKTPVQSIVVYSDTVSDYAFEGCTELKTVEFKNDLTYIGVNAFKGCKKLDGVVFDASCEQIANYAFADCKKLTSFTLPNCSVDFGDYVFENCEALKEIVFDENTVIDGGIGIFSGMSGYTVNLDSTDKYVLDGGAVYTADRTELVLVIPASSVTAFEVAKSVKTIAPGAFSNNSYITTVTFEDGSELTEIGYGAFANCTMLKTLALPDRAVSLGDYSFANTWALSTVNLSKIDEVGVGAFRGSAIKTLNLTYDGVKIGSEAFMGCTNLISAVIGKGAVIGDFAFAVSSIKSVDFVDDGKSCSAVTVGEGAFRSCTSLSSVDFADISGKVGSFAFYGCTSITSVNMPEATELGEACFADCTRLSSFTAPKLETIGSYALGIYSNNVGSGAPLTTVSLPSLKKVGSYAFAKCLALKSIDLSNVTEIGESAFLQCTGLITVVLSENLTEIGDYAFMDCTALANFNIENVEKFGYASFFNVKLPAVLNLNAAREIGVYAFSRRDTTAMTLKTLNAPELVSVADFAFERQGLLSTVITPKLEVIGSAAFSQTAIVEFEVSASLKSVASGAFYGTQTFKAFRTTVDGAAVYDAVVGNARIKDGVLYINGANGYTLVSYPYAKENKEFAIEEGTVRIEQHAFALNNYLEKVTLPESLDYIGDYAFYLCENLETVVFKSYYAPVLEGYPLTEAVDLNKDTAANYPGFDSLYKYSYYYKTLGQVVSVFYYRNFVDLVTSEKASNLTYVIPENSDGYDSLIYTAYFKSSDENSGKVMGPNAIAFIEAVNDIPDTVDRFNIQEIETAILAYNALKGTEDESYIDSALVEKFNLACSAYNVSVVENKLNHLFDMDNSKYSFDLVKEAREAVRALSADELKALSNAAVLDEKIAELAAAMGKTPDFSITYEEHFPEEPPVEEPPAGGDEEPEEPKGMSGILKAVIITASTVAVLAAAYGVIYLIKWKISDKGSSPDGTDEKPEEKKEENTESASDDEEK